MRKRSIKKIWSIIIITIFAIFLIENLFCVSPPVPDLTSTSDEGQGHATVSIKSISKPQGKREVHSNIMHADKPRPKENSAVKINHHRNKFIEGSKESIPRKSSTKVRLSKWIVVFSQKGCDVTHFTTIPGWKVVVIGSAPIGCNSASSCTYIDGTKERSLGYSLIKLLKEKSESQKMIGYLFAISKGANIIYDADCNIVPKFNQIDFEFTGNTSGLAFTGGPIFNPYAHYGYPMLFPRGFPDNTQNVKGQGRYRIVETEVPLIQQGQVNFGLEKADVTYLSMARNFNVTFDRSSPPVFISGHRYGPINSVNTVFLYDAFWALFFPTNSKRESDIVRGYIAQRLLYKIGGCVGYVTATAYTLSHSRGQNKFIASKLTTNTYLQNLLAALKQWKCVSNESFFKCAKLLIKHLKNNNLLTSDDSKLFNAWIFDLKSVGYKEPKMRTYMNPATSPGHWNPLVVYESPKVVPSEIILPKDKNQIATYAYSMNKLQEICPKQNYHISNWINPPITDIMLVVIFNFDFLIKNLPNMEFTHRMYFRHILYCGPDFKGLTKLLKETNMHHVIYIDGVDKDTWFFTYQCIVHAANLKLNVKGYLYIGDDILLNTWNLVDLPRDKFWMPQPVTSIERNQLKHPWWYYWNKPVGRKAANLYVEELQNTLKENPSDTMVKNFIQMYDHNVNISKAIHRSIDAFYAPALYNKEIVRFGKIFRRHNTLLGLAVPMLYSGLVDRKDIIHFKGRSLWKKDRLKNKESFKEDSFYLHPFKMIKDVSEKSGRKFFCETYMKLATSKLVEINNRRRKKHS